MGVPFFRNKTIVAIVAVAVFAVAAMMSYMFAIEPEFGKDPVVASWHPSKDMPDVEDFTPVACQSLGKSAASAEKAKALVEEKYSDYVAKANFDSVEYRIIDSGCSYGWEIQHIFVDDGNETKHSDFVFCSDIYDAETKILHTDNTDMIKDVCDQLMFTATRGSVIFHDVEKRDSDYIYVAYSSKYRESSWETQSTYNLSKTTYTATHVGDKTWKLSSKSESIASKEA